jgi:hypothetical protein
MNRSWFATGLLTFDHECSCAGMDDVQLVLLMGSLAIFADWSIEFHGH